MEEPHKSRPSTVLLVEDFEPFRRLIRVRLKKRSDFHVVGELSDGHEAVSEAEMLRPDVVVLDLNLPSADGFEAARRILRTASESKIIFLTQETDVRIVRRAFELGAKGYVAKIDVAELPSAIDAVLDGHEFVSQSISETLRGFRPSTP